MYGIGVILAVTVYGMGVILVVTVSALRYRSHSGGDSVTSWDLGPRQYLSENYLAEKQVEQTKINWVITIDSSYRTLFSNTR